MDESKPDHFFQIPCYELLRRDRKDRQGGGVLCYIKTSLSYEIVKDFDNLLDEAITIRVKNQFSKSFIVSFVYRPPNMTKQWESNFLNYLDGCSRVSEEIVMLGDFNINLLDKNVKFSWLSKLSPFSLKQLVSLPTRVTEKTSTLIDHIYTNREINMREVRVLETSMSDHYLTYVVRKIGVPPHSGKNKIQFVDYSGLCHSRLNELFRNENWDTVRYSKNVHQMMENFNEIFLSKVNSCVKRREKFVRSNVLPIWFDDELRENIKKRDSLKKNSDWDSYRKQRNYVTNLVNKKKRSYLSELVKRSKNKNTKPVWEALNLGHNKKKLCVEESTLDAETLNTHFTTIASKLAEKFTPQSSVASKIDTPPFDGSKVVLSNFDRFTPSKICFILKNIEEKKSTGSDNISVKVLKKTLPYIINILCDMFNRILIDAQYPDAWKIARVAPIFKGGERNDPSNYRPISVLPIVSKIFERHINSELNDFLNKKKFMHSLQSGFRAGFSCSTSIHKFVSDTLSCKKQNGFAVALFLDFCKAFDCVDHSILCNKLKSINIFGPSFDLFHSFLSDRVQFVRFNGFCSDPKPISIGVPQGSILAPTLFLIYINDLLKLPLTSSSYAYADDTVFLANHRDPDTLEHICNSDLERIHRWSCVNKMTINFKKSHFVCFNAGKKYQFCLRFNNMLLRSSPTSKLLGFHINENLTWDDHIEHLSTIITKNVNLLKLCRKYLTSFSARQFYFQFIHSQFMHGIQIFSSLCSNRLIEKLHLIQKSALRVVANTHYIPFHLIPSADICRSLKILPYPILCKYFRSVYAFKIFNGQCPDYIHDLFQPCFTHRYPKRDTFLLYTPCGNIESNISKDFNSLPFSLRHITSLYSFKKASFQFYFLQV